MGRKCSVLGCRTNYAKKKKETGAAEQEPKPVVSIHTFPRNPEQRAAWIKALNRKDFTESQANNGGICSRHFHPSLISYQSADKRTDRLAGQEIQNARLADAAIPDRYLGYSPYRASPAKPSPAAATAAKLRDRAVKRRLILDEGEKTKEAKKEAKRQRLEETAARSAADKAEKDKAELTFKAVEHGCQGSAWFHFRNQNDSSLRLLFFSVSDVTKLLAEVVIRDSFSWLINILNERDTSLEIKIISEHGIKPTVLSSLAEVETLKRRAEAAATEADAASKAPSELPCPSSVPAALALLRELYKKEDKEDEHRWLLEQLELDIHVQPRLRQALVPDPERAPEHGSFLALELSHREVFVEMCLLSLSEDPVLSALLPNPRLTCSQSHPIIRSLAKSFFNCFWKYHLTQQRGASSNQETLAELDKKSKKLQGKGGTSGLK